MAVNCHAEIERIKEREKSYPCSIQYEEIKIVKTVCETQWTVDKTPSLEEIFEL